MKENILSVINCIAEDILSLAYLILDENGLQKSALREDVAYTIEHSNNPVIRVIFNDYISYIENGRKPGKGEIPPISELREWALNKGLPADNDTLFAIAQTIYKNGIAPRPLLARFEQEIEQSFHNKWADNLFDAIVDSLRKFFS